MSKRKLDEASTIADDSPNQPPVFTSTPIHDRGSIFTAIFSPSTTSPRSFQKHPPFEGAMHKILAWRKTSAQKSLVGSFGASTSDSTARGNGVAKVVYETGSDEDGEKYAGKKVEKVLVEMDVAGTVVVARWYGGVLLGPVRFKWIEDAAREAIGKWKATLGEVKRVKVDEGKQVDDVKEKERLVNVLKERDASVVVLRELLAEKNRELRKLEVGEEEEVGKGSEGRSGEVIKSPVAAALDYNEMPQQRLKQLEKARDASLSWILKQIDAVEEKMEAMKTAKERAR